MGVFALDDGGLLLRSGLGGGHADLLLLLLGLLLLLLGLHCGVLLGVELCLLLLLGGGELLLLLLRRLALDGGVGSGWRAAERLRWLGGIGARRGGRVGAYWDWSDGAGGGGGAAHWLLLLLLLLLDLLDLLDLLLLLRRVLRTDWLLRRVWNLQRHVGLVGRHAAGWEPGGLARLVDGRHVAGHVRRGACARCVGGCCDTRDGLLWLHRLLRLHLERRRRLLRAGLLWRRLLMLLLLHGGHHLRLLLLGRHGARRKRLLLLLLLWGAGLDLRWWLLDSSGTCLLLLVESSLLRLHLLLLLVEAAEDFFAVRKLSVGLAELLFNLGLSLWGMTSPVQSLLVLLYLQLGRTEFVTEVVELAADIDPPLVGVGR